MTARRECRRCHTRLLTFRGFPPLNFMPDPLGNVAVPIADPVVPRWLAKGEQPGPLEKAYAVHECPDGRGGKGRWTSAQRGHAQPRKPRQPSLPM